MFSHALLLISGWNLGGNMSDARITANGSFLPGITHILPIHVHCVRRKF